MNSLSLIGNSYNYLLNSNKITFSKFTDMTSNIYDLSFNKIAFSAGSGQSQPCTSNLGVYSLFYGMYLINYVYKSSNNATSFNKINFNTGSIISSAMSEDGLYQYFTSTGPNYLYISTNYGSSFSTVGISSNLRSVDCSNDGKYVLITGKSLTGTSGDYYIGLSSNYGISFSSIKGNLSNFSISSNECTIGCITDDGNSIYICISGTNGGIFKSINALSGNVTYSKVFSTTLQIFSATMSNDGKYAIFATNTPASQLYITTNDGTSFTTLNISSTSFVSSLSMDKTGQYCMATDYSSNKLYYWNNFISSSYNTATLPVGKNNGFTCCISPDATVGYAIYSTTSYPPANVSTNINYFYKIT